MSYAAPHTRGPTARSTALKQCTDPCASALCGSSASPPFLHRSTPAYSVLASSQDALSSPVAATCYAHAQCPR
eukprot:6213746-Pleurochrysis_carterae.AAC.4